jgi:tyrosine-protein kinase Etk/Wzc
VSNGKQSSVLINKDYNPEIAATIIRRYWWLPVAVIMIFIALGWIYLRYTKPLYESSTVIQIASEDQGKEILEVENINAKDNISSEIELLKSELLFNIAIERLHMNVSLFSKGQILTEEKYHQSTFNVQPYQLRDSTLCDIPIYVSLQGSDVALSYDHNGRHYKLKRPANTHFTNDHFDIVVKVDNLSALRSDDEDNELYFTFNNKKALVSRLLPNLEVLPLDVEAKTVQITYRGNNPELCRDISNAVASAFFDYDEEVKRKSSDNILLFIEQQLDSISGKLQQSKDSLSYFQRTAGLPDPENESESLNEDINRFQDQLFEVESELATLKLVASKLRSDPDRLEIYRLIPEMLGKSYEASLTKQIEDLHGMLARKEDLLFDVTDENPEIKTLNLRIQSRIQSIRKSVDVIEERLRANAAVLRGKVSGFEGEFLALPEKKMEYNRLRSRQELNEKYYALLTEKKVQYSISNKGYVSNNRILSEAAVSTAPVSPSRKFVYGGFALIGVLISLGILLFRYVTFNEINTIDDLKSLLPEKVTILGNIPLLRNTSEFSQLMVHEAPKSMLAEAMRNIRTNLGFVNTEMRVIAISSSISGEGKTFVALNLAGIIALSGKRTVVIDLDLRKPKVHLGFNVPNTHGISNLIIKKVTLDECIHQSPVENLDFITAGPIPPNPSELILSKGFEDILEELKQRYDVVVIDNPPIGLVTDGVKTLVNADVPIYIFKSHYSKRIFANRVKELFEMKQLDHLNIILNGTKGGPAGRYGYGYGYGYGYDYYEENTQAKKKKE